MEIKSELEIFESQITKENKIDDIMENAGQMSKGEELGSKPINTSQIKKIMKSESFEELQKRNPILNDELIRKGSAKFYIGTKDKIVGQITYFEKENKQKFILGRVLKKEDKMNGGFYYPISNLTDNISSRDKEKTFETIEGELYLYKFQTKEKTYQIFSTKKLGLGEYTLWGTIVEILDDVDMGNYCRIGTKQPLLFVHTAFSKECQIQSHKEFIERFRKYDLTEKKLIDWLYTSPNGWIYEFPRDFSLIQLSNLIACKDDFNTFHMPVLMIGDTGTGKTTATELIFNRMNEVQGYTDMTSSTLKGLVPSFRNPNELKQGLLLGGLRYVPVDEFLAGVKNLHQDEQPKIMENIKNVLDYKLREHSSGNGNMKAQMKAQHIALSNPKGYARDILSLSKRFPPENLTRYLIWYIPKSHEEFINLRKTQALIKGEYNFIAKSDFLEGIDYLNSFNCEYDKEKVKGIYEIGEKFLKGKEDNYKELRSIYS